MMPSIESNIVLIDQCYGNNHYNVTMVDVQKDVISILLICMWLEMIATEITHVRVNMTHEFGGFICRSLQPTMHIMGRARTSGYDLTNPESH